MNFSTNQNRQFYVATAASKPEGKDYLLLTTSTGEVRTDMLTNIEYVAKSEASTLAMHKTVATVNLNGDFVVGTPVLLTVEIPNYAGGGDEYSRSTIISLAVASETAIKTDGVEAVVKALTKAFPEYEFAVALAATKVTITANYKVSNWRLGVSPMRTTTLVVSGENVTSVTIAKGAAIEGTPGIALAELEYFCKGERGDQYRMMGYPNVIPSKYDIDPTKLYTVYDIHFSYVGSNEMVQKSEKDITIAILQAASGTAATNETLDSLLTE